MRVDGKPEKGEIASFTGLSTDTKPMPAPQGAVYHSVDTGERWVYNEGMWAVDISTVKRINLFG